MEILSCSCCGSGIRNNPEENVDYGKIPYPHDNGMGMCKGCGGDPNAKSIRKKLGWANCAFYDARIQLLNQRLNDENLKKFKSLTYLQKVVVIEKLIKKGVLV